ncbi:type II toxin-antitoxin system Phd/YefM family antitoxin [Coxiella burnetii]|uniref:Antitoxin n=2 Tax=Coxiella burnetii TaxID=777 RepID=Q83AB4_COXBU|nr:type II toxin-antitoxin system prevent-host-death family antitoxin [Coxiella burnetii]NP_820966.1 toxin-antitoxin system antitoxin RelB [Coxiella burnetii RSA 493]AAO91480.1 RelB [Coxiella burnetii RSA 493]ABS77672.1 RelB [Coxiella burnetii Dugway 5J108-111]ACJ19241.1 RelB [Coxiella burnetii CbuG_Q212]ACJ21140.1 RelB [Coxiella burnetii CbuK_Q154]AIT64212.1 Antitoxin yefM [Coxiella burnetii str. Namibia]
MNVVTFSELRAQLKKILDLSADQHEPVVVKRPNKETMVILSLRDFEALKETAYLLSNEANAARLRQSIRSLKQGKAQKKKLMED